MRRVIARAIPIVCFASIAAVAAATTIRPIEVTCPVDGTVFRAHSLGSTNTFGGQDRDFFSKARGLQPIEVVIWSCPKCHYTGYSRDFRQPVAETVATAIRGGALVPMAGGSAGFVRYDLLAQVLALGKGPALARADAYLRASWSARSYRRSAQEEMFQLKAAPLFEEALAKGEVPAKNVPALTYLVGELNRRLGRFDDAIKWFDKAEALPDVKEWLRGWIREQRVVARARLREGNAAPPPVAPGIDVDGGAAVAPAEDGGAATLRATEPDGGAGAVVDGGSSPAP